MKNKSAKKKKPSAAAASLSLPPVSLPNWVVVIPILLPLALYIYTAAPGVTLVDSGELALACRTLGMAHPPGFPLYVMLGHLFSLLPLGGGLSQDAARHLNLFSALCAALAAGISYLLTRELIPTIDARMALAGAVAFGFSLSLWSWAIVTEVYSLNILLLAVMFWFASRGDWWKTALAAGLALGVHHATVVMALPAAAFLLWSRRRPVRRDLVLAAVAGLLGLCVYAYLPIAASRGPSFNWGDPRTLERFWWHISAKQYRVHLFEASFDELATRVVFFVRLWGRQMAPSGFLLAGIGLIALVKRDRRIFWFTALLAVLNVGFALNYDIAEDIEGYYLPAFLAGSWCFALGGEWFCRRLPKPGLVLVCAAALLPAIVHFPENNRHADRIAPLYVDNTLRAVDPASLIVTSDWQFYSPWLYLRHVGGLRPDIIVVDTLMMRRAWYLDFLTQQYPALVNAAREEMTAYRTLLDRFEHDEPYNAEAIDAAFVALVEKFARVKLTQGNSVYYTLKLERPFLRDQPIAPAGLLYRVGREPVDVDFDLSGLKGGVPLDATSLQVRRTYAAMLWAHRKQDAARQLDPEFQPGKP